MKRIALITGPLVALLLVLLVLQSPDPTAPQFKKFDSLPANPPSHPISYDFLNPRPFEGGEMWITFWSGKTNSQAWLYDIGSRTVLGQLTNGWPVMMNRNQSELLCLRPGAERRPSLMDRAIKLVDRLSRGRIRWQRLRRRPGSEPHRFWFLNLKSNAAKVAGELPERPAMSFFPSPSFRYVYTGLHEGMKIAVYCFDFQSKSVEKLDVGGWPSGWWADDTILVLNTNNDFVLYGVKTKQAIPFVGFSQIAALLRQNDIPENSSKAQAFSAWNGRDYDFYLTDGHQRWLAQESYLIKVERPNGTLKLLSRRFKFEWSDHFDPTGRYYLYSGREAGERSSGVFVREMASGTNRTLVKSDGGQYFSIPQFYQDSVIFIRSNALWRIHLDGTQNLRLFPP